PVGSTIPHRCTAPAPLFPTPPGRRGSCCCTPPVPTPEAGPTTAFTPPPRPPPSTSLRPWPTNGPKTVYASTASTPNAPEHRCVHTPSAKNPRAACSAPTASPAPPSTSCSPT